MTLLRFQAVLLLLLSALPGFASGAEEFLQTPYSAEQIRDAWQEGLEIVTHDTTPAGETWSRTTVRKWAPDSVEFAVQELDEAGAAVGEEQVGSATWIELRDHARFPTARADRSRVVRDTVLGRLEGWLYTVTEEDGGSSEFFFADLYPGPPVIYSRSRDGEILLHSEMVDLW